MPARKSSARVAVIGAGLAGLSCAIELAERGVPVVVLEAAGIAGGRVKSWRDADGDTIEHGLHKWYHQYRNYRALMDRVGCGNVLLAPRKADVLRLTGTREVVFQFNHGLPAPLNFSAFVLRDLANLPLWGRAQVAAGMLAGCSFDRRIDYHDGLDDVSIGELCSRFRLDGAVYRQLVEPLTVYLHALRADRASFASTMDGALFAVLGNRRAFEVQGLKGGPGELVIDPMVAYLRRQGGELLLGARVTEVEIAGGRVAGLTYRHGGQERRLPVDYLVSAADIAGLQPLLQGDLGRYPQLARVTQLEPITIWVARLWLDRPVPITTQLIADFRLAFLVYNLSAFQKEFARRKDQTVLEVMMPDVRAYEHLPDEAVRAQILAELGALFPACKGAGVRKFVLNKWERTYTPHGVGTYRLFPARRTPLDNFFLAGDWVRCPEHPAVYQEKAVVTGRLAANDILRREHLAEAPLLPALADDWTIALLKLAGRAAHPRASAHHFVRALRRRLFGERRP